MDDTRPARKTVCNLSRLWRSWRVGRNRQQDEEVLEHPYPDRRNHRSGCRNRQQDEEVLEPE